MGTERCTIKKTVPEGGLVLRRPDVLLGCARMIFTNPAAAHAGRTVILDAILVPTDLTIELVDQLVDGGIEVFVRVFDVDVATFHVEIDLGLLPTSLLLLLLDGQRDRDVDHLVEVPRHAVELSDDVLAQRRGHFEVMPADRQIHRYVSSDVTCMEGIPHRHRLGTIVLQITALARAVIR
jgi:hypothetical protein